MSQFKTKKFKTGVSFAILIGVLFAYQNCERAKFTSVGEETLSSSLSICNPLDPGAVCDFTQRKGLAGNLYWLSEQNALHVDRFGGGCHYSPTAGLCRAKLQDYFDLGYLVKNPVLMTQINISPRSWQAGFTSGAGEIVENDNQEKLFDFFSLKIQGFIELTEGEYQFAILSDDGMRILIDDQVVVVDDGIHAPRWKCGAATGLSFKAGEKRKIQVEYFQGPRVEIAMQLFKRPISKSNLPCSAAGEWEEIGPEAFTY